jgi:DNA-binding transcriptional ArsR family regulator
VSRPAATSDIFAAIAHPIRRAILERLALRESPVLALAAPFGVTLGALSQHLKVLREAGLVGERRDGRQRIYRLVPEPIHEVADWTATFAPFWDEKLDDLGALLRKRHDAKHRPRAALPASHRRGVGGDDR